MNDQESIHLDTSTLSIENTKSYSIESKNKHQSEINFLPENIIDQIRAGEVIERPGDILKETIENSIDSGANKIEIEILNAGIDSITIKDDGHGMSGENLEKAFYRHATSKISNLQDLSRVKSFGFRGEALASIASIAQVECLSKSKNCKEEGHQIKWAGGKFIGIQEVEYLNTGTTLKIQNLFFNTPARFNFLKSNISEKNYMKKIINFFLISHPHIFFTVKWDDKHKEIYLKHKNLEERIKSIVLKNNSSLLKSEVVKFENYEVKIYPYKSPRNSLAPRLSFLNDRFFSDGKINQIINQYAYDKKIGFYIFIKVPSEHCDVNVHPAKTKIKFLYPAKVYSLVKTLVQKISKNHKLCSDKKNSPNNLKSTNNGNINNDIIGITPNNLIDQPNFINWKAFNIEDDLFLIKIIENNINAHIFLIDIKKAFAKYIGHKIKENINQNLSEKDHIPLLITIPLPSDIKPTEMIISFLSEIGIEIEKGRHYKIIGLPSFLKKNYYFKGIEDFIKKTTSYRNGNNEASLLNIFIDTILLDFSLSQNITDKISQSEFEKYLLKNKHLLFKEKIARQITQSEFHSIF